MIVNTSMTLITCLCSQPRLLIVDLKKNTKNKYTHHNEPNFPQLACSDYCFCTLDQCFFLACIPKQLTTQMSHMTTAQGKVTGLAVN